MRLPRLKEDALELRQSALVNCTTFQMNLLQRYCMCLPSWQHYWFLQLHGGVAQAQKQFIHRDSDCNYWLLMIDVWSRAAIYRFTKPCIAFSVLGPRTCTAAPTWVWVSANRPCHMARSSVHGTQCMCFASSAGLAASPVKRCPFFFSLERFTREWVSHSGFTWARCGRWSIPLCPGQPREVVVGHSKGYHRAPTKAISHVKLPISITYVLFSFYFFLRFLITSNLWTHAWNIKYK
jgi:hypothetical protein